MNNPITQLVDVHYAMNKEASKDSMNENEVCNQTMTYARYVIQTMNNNYVKLNKIAKG